MARSGSGWDPRRIVLAFSCTAMLVVSCSTAQQAPRAEPVRSSAVLSSPLGSGIPAATSGPPSVGEARGEPSAGSLSDPVSSHTADAGGTVGQAEVWLGQGSDPAGMQRRLELGDRPGPLLEFSGEAPGTAYELLDLCERPHWADERFEPRMGMQLPEWGMRWRSRNQAEDDLANCTWRRFRVVEDGEDARYGRQFSSRAVATEWVQQRQRDAVRSDTLPPDSLAMGFTESVSYTREGPFGIVFAAWDAPVDDIRVLAETVAVRDGVLRGLVRNWSRRLWAYEVTVSAGDHTFDWPLSIQPGEVAPFEIHAWDGPADPKQINITTDTEMSPHVDPSRAFSPGYGATLWMGSETQRALADELRDCHPELTADLGGDATSQGIVRWSASELRTPDSHPSLAEDIERLVVSDLRGYGATFDGQGRITDVGPAVISSEAWPPWQPFGSLIVLTNLSVDNRDEIPQLDVVFDMHMPPRASSSLGESPPRYGASAKRLNESGGWAWDGIDGGFILWIGAAHPERDPSEP